MTIAPVTLSEEEYRALGDDACNQIKRLVEANLHETWPHIEWDEPDLKVYGRKCVEFEEAHENMLMLVTTLQVKYGHPHNLVNLKIFLQKKRKVCFQTSIVKVERLLFPWFDYRVKWDEMLDRADIADKFSQEVSKSKIRTWVKLCTYFFSFFYYCKVTFNLFFRHTSSDM